VQPAHPEYDIGVIVGRFQIHELHDAHRDLISYVIDRHKKVVIFLGTSPLPNSTNNPLDFESRKQMILAEFPQAIVLYVKDHPSDTEWSKKLDEQINDLRVGSQTVVLYGGRDSFISHYTGKFPTQELLQETFMSGNAVRKEIARSSARNSPEFRAGAIWASQSRFPTAYQCVDVVVLNEDGTKILLGQKKTDGDRWRFFGGFSDPRSESLEQDARREVAEEAGIEIGDVTYVGSTIIDDWRYRSEPDCIKTALFRAKYLHGRPAPGDDIDVVQWFPVAVSCPYQYIEKHLVPSHLPLLNLLKEN
jgi:bifunctional NMN adenylyltransferase/nudix hydrolase